MVGIGTSMDIIEMGDIVEMQDFVQGLGARGPLPINVTDSESEILTRSVRREDDSDRGYGSDSVDDVLNRPRSLPSNESGIPDRVQNELPGDEIPQTFVRNFFGHKK